MELHLKIISCLLIFLALIHLAFPRFFNWTKEFATLSLINRQMMYVHTFFISLVVLLMGLLCLTSPLEIIETALGKKIALGFGLFWMARLFIQFFIYSSILWKGKLFETIIHVLFSVCWTYLSIVFLTIYLG